MSSTALSPSSGMPSPSSQSSAGLLPPELVDAILSRLDFDYSSDVPLENARKRDRILSNISIIARNWTGSARRLLYRSLRIRSWRHLLARPNKWEGSAVESLSIDVVPYGVHAWGREPPDCSREIFELLVKIPNVKSIMPHYVPFDRFDYRSHTLLHESQVLPSLRHLSLSVLFPSLSLLQISSRHQETPSRR